MRDIVVMGGAYGSVLSLCRKIRRVHGVRCYAIIVNNKGSNVFNASNCITESVDIIIESPDDLVKKTGELYTRWEFNGKPILYFGSDICCILVDARRSWFEERFELCLPSGDIINSFTRKGVAEREAAKNGLLVPRTTEVSKMSDLEAVATTYQYPVIIKPCSVQLKKGIDFKVKVLEKENFMKECSDLLQAGAIFICQEYIPGGDEMAWYYLFSRGRSGRVVEHMGIKKLQSPPGQGIMAIGESRWDPELSVLSQKFLSHINYLGVGGIEFKKYRGNYYFIEMSTRMEGFFLLGEMDGESLALSSYAEFNDLDKRVTRKVQPSKQPVVFVDLVPCWEAIKTTRRYVSFISLLVKGFFSPRYSFNIASYSDPKPFFRILGEMVGSKMQQ